MSTRGRCDHDPRRPRFRLEVAVSPRLPWITKTAMKRAENLFTKPGRFPEITMTAIAGAGARVHSRRSSFREALALVTKALMRRADRRTWRVGTPREDGLCNGHPIAEIVKETRLSRPRVCRALRALEGARYIESSQPVEELERPKVRPNGTVQTHRGFPSVRWVTPLFTKRLGIKEEKRRAASAHGAAAWRRRRARALSPVALEGLRRFREGSRSKFDPKKFETTAAERLERLRLRELHPDWSAARVAAQARRPPPPKP